MLPAEARRSILLRGMVFLASENLATMMPSIVQESVKVEKVTRADGKEVPRVVAVKDIAAGQLQLVPMVRDQHSIVDRTSNPMKIKVSIGGGCEKGGDDVFMLPCAMLTAKKGLEPFVPPFWLVKRSPRQQDANCRLAMIPYTAITTGVVAGHRIGNTVQIDFPGAFL